MRRFSLWLLPCSVLLFATLARPASSDLVYYAPSDPELDWVLSLNETPWSDSAIYGAMTALVMEQTTPLANICDPVFRTDAAAALGFVLPAWTLVDYRQHLDFIESVYIDLYARTIVPMGSDNETWQRLERQFWDDFSESILDTFAAGTAVMEATDLDVDKDGQIETLFRLPALTPRTRIEGSSTPELGTAWDVFNCQGGPPGVPVNKVRLSPESAATHGAYGEVLERALDSRSSMLLFRFEGRIHALYGSGREGEVVDIVRKGDYASVTNSIWSGIILTRTGLKDGELVIPWISE